MNTWRSFVVLLVASLGGFVGAAIWVVPMLSDPSPRVVSRWSVFEGASLMMSGVFVSGRAAARLLVDRETAREILISGRWRLTLLRFITGTTMIAAHLLDGASRRDSVPLLIGVVFVLWALGETWCYWVLPALRRRGF